MPLHTISEVIGEEGLSRRFFIEIASFSPEEQEVLNRAYALSSKFHAEDRRQREPAMSHILRVAIRIMHHYDFKDPAVIAAALMHDLVEDHAKDMTDIDDKQEAIKKALAMLADEFGDDISNLVGAVTNPVFDKQDWHQQYRDHVIELLRTNPRAAIIKISDFTDNATGIIYTPQAKAESVAPKYEPLVPEFKQAIASPEVPLSDEVKAHILHQMDLTTERLQSVINGQ